MEINELQVKLNSLESKLKSLEDNYINEKDEVDYHSKLIQELKKEFIKLGDENNKKLDSLIKEKLDSLLNDKFREELGLLKSEIKTKIKDFEKELCSKIDIMISHKVSGVLHEALNKVLDKISPEDYEKMINDIIEKKK